MQACPRCGGSGRNYVNLWACRAGMKGSRVTPCPQCVLTVHPQYAPKCAKEKALFKAVQANVAFVEPPCACDQCSA